jgi:hypothetical protein
MPITTDEKLFVLGKYLHAVAKGNISVNSEYPTPTTFPFSP